MFLYGQEKMLCIFLKHKLSENQSLFLAPKNSSLIREEISQINVFLRSRLDQSFILESRHDKLIFEKDNEWSYLLAIHHYIISCSIISVSFNFSSFWSHTKSKLLLLCVI